MEEAPTTPRYCRPDAIAKLEATSAYTRSEIRLMYRGFKQVLSLIIISLLRHERYENENTWHNAAEQNKNYISNHMLSLRSSLSACTAVKIIFCSF